MECLLALCLYIEGAVGYSYDVDGQSMLDGGVNVNRAGEVVLSNDGTMGHVAVGAEYQAGRYTLYFEGDHRSIIETSADGGINSAWIGGRVTF